MWSVLGDEPPSFDGMAALGFVPHLTLNLLLLWPKTGGRLRGCWTGTDISAVEIVSIREGLLEEVILIADDARMTAVVAANAVQDLG
jgi:hypothetical protein